MVSGLEKQKRIRFIQHAKRDVTRGFDNKHDTASALTSVVSDPKTVPLLFWRGESMGYSENTKSPWGSQRRLGPVIHSVKNIRKLLFFYYYIGEHSVSQKILSKQSNLYNNFAILSYMIVKNFHLIAKSISSFMDHIKYFSKVLTSGVCLKTSFFCLLGGFNYFHFPFMDENIWLLFLFDSKVQTSKCTGK